MPRIENLGSNVDAWHQNSGGEGSSTWDVCFDCAYKLLKNPHAFDARLPPYKGDPPGNMGRGGDVEHPEYARDRYFCTVCNLRLTDDDEKAPIISKRPKGYKPPKMLGPESIDPFDSDNPK